MTIYSYYSQYLANSTETNDFNALFKKYEAGTLEGEEVPKWAALVKSIEAGRAKLGADYNPSNPLPCCFNLTNLIGTVAAVAVVVGAIFLIASLALSLGALWIGIGAVLTVGGAIGTGFHAFQNLRTATEK